MAQWIEDPQNRQEIEKVTKELKLPVWKANYKGKFREFWNEVWSKIEDNFLNLKNIVETKEPTITKKPGFNLDKTDNYNEDDTNKLGTAKALKALYDELNKKIEALDICPYKVGDIYVTTNTANPADLWSGTSWEKIEGRFLKATNSEENPKTMGGSNSKTLTVANIPSHNHSIWIGENGYHTHVQDAHTHTQPAHSHGINYVKSGGWGVGDGLGRRAPGGASGQYPSQYAGGENTGGAQPTIYGNGNHSHSASIGNTGSGSAFDVTPAYYAVNMWIRIG